MITTVEQALHVAGPDVRPQARQQVDRGGLSERDDGAVQRDGVGDHHGVGALGDGDVEQPERRDLTLDLAGDRPALEANAVPDPERPRADEHHAGDEVAEGLLGRETEDDGGEGTTEREGARRDPRDAQCDENGRDDRHQPDQEPDGAGGGGVQTPQQSRTEGLADVARERPADRDEEYDRDDPGGLVDPEEIDAIVVGHEDAREQRPQKQRLAPRPAGLLLDPIGTVGRQEHAGAQTPADVSRGHDRTMPLLSDLKLPGVTR